MANRTNIKKHLIDANAFLSLANQYYLAGSKLFSFQEKIEAPVYFLFTHSIELTLKAYLNLHQPYTKRIHSNEVLIKECIKEGLLVSDEIIFLIRTLENENKEHGFRYFIFKPTVKPSLNYLQEVAKELLLKVSAFIPAKKIDGKVVLKFVIDKPQKKMNLIL